MPSTWSLRTWTTRSILAGVLLPFAGLAYGAEAPERPSCETGDELAPIRSCLERVRQLKDQEHEARSLIAVLPDPSMTPFAREFDVFLLSIQQAMAAEDLQLDKLCLPWRSGADRDPAAGVEREVGPVEALPVPGLAVYRGMQLERRGAEGQRVPVVYSVLVVGEAPPAGVPPEAMGRALTLVAKGGCLSDVAGHEPGPLPAIEILGPTFSGSARSLGLALRGWQPPIPKRRWPQDAAVRQPVRIVSGSATNTDLADNIEGAIGASRMAELDLVSFRSVANSNLDLQSCLWNRVVPERVGLKTRWEGGGKANELLCPPRERDERASSDDDDPNKRVALLVELSAFGRQFTDFTDANFEVVTFPPHLGALRNAYERLAKDKAAAGSSTTAQAQATTLMTDLTSRLQDGMSMFGRDSTLSSLDLVLNNTLRQLARERVRVVGIVATSVADKIFLAEKVRRYVPDVRMVTVEGDVLLSHPRHHPSTAGMLVVSSSKMEVTQPTRLEFDFDWAHGVYLATQQLVRGVADPGEHERAAPGEIYVSVVSRTGLSHVEVIGGGARPDPQPEPETEPGERGELLGAGLGLGAGGGGKEGGSGGGDSLPIIWKSLVFLASALLFLLVYAGGRALYHGEALLGVVPLDLIDVRQWRAGEEQPRDLVLHALVALLPMAIGVVYFVISFPSFSADDGLSQTAGVCLVLLAVTAAYLWLGLGVRTWAALVDVARKKPWSLRGYGAALLPALLVLLAIAAIVGLGQHAIDWFSHDLDPGAQALLVDRFLSLSGGLSPLVPVALIAAVVVAWLVVALRWRERQPAAGDPPDGGAAAVEGTLEKRSRQLWRALDLLADGWPKLGAWVVVVLFPLLYLGTLFGWPPLRGVENGAEIDLTTTVLLAVALLLALGAALSAVRGWWGLRDVVEALGSARLEIESLPRQRQAVALRPLREALDAVASPDEATVELKRLSASEADLAWWHAAAHWLDREAAPKAEALHPLVALAFRQTTGRLVRLAYRQLGNLMTFATLALITLFLAIGAYPFEPRRMVLLYLGLLVVAVATASVTIVLQARNEPLLKDLTGADGTWSSTRPLLQQLGFYAGLPVFGLLTARFPELRGLLGEWLDPIVMALK